MKRLLKVFIFMLFFTTAFFGFVGCGETTKVENIFVELEEANEIFIAHKDTFNPLTDVDVKAKLSDGSIKDIDEDDCDFSVIDTNTIGKQELIISYGNYETKVDIEVYKWVSEVYVKSGTIPTEVNHNGVLDTSNARLILKYSDNSLREVSEGFTVGRADTTTVGSHMLTINYSELSCTHTYTVNKVLEILTVSGNYAKSLIWNNSDLVNYNYAPVTALAKWSNSEAPEIITSDNLTFVNKIVENQKGEQTFTISYGGKTATSETINVYTEIETITVTGLTDSFKYGTFDKTILIFSAGYTDGETKVLNSNNVDAFYDQTALGDVVVTFSYTENNVTKQTTANINVYEELESLVVEPVDAETSKYFLTGTNFEKDNFEYFAQNTKTRVEITDLLTITISEVKDDNGQKYVEATYQGKTTRINIEFVNSWDQVPTVSITGIEVGGTYETNVAHNSNNYDYSGIEVIVSYSNGENKTLNYNDVQITTQIDTKTVGKTNFTVKYGDFTDTSDDIYVLRTLISVDVKNPITTKVLWGTDNFLDNIKLTVTYSNGEEDIDAKLYAVGENLARPILTGDIHEIAQSITFSYTPSNCYDNNSKTCTMNVTIYEEFVKFGAEGIEKTVNYSRDETAVYDLSKLKVYFYYTSGNKVEVNERTDLSSGYKVTTTVDLNIVGRQPVTIIYYELVSEKTTNTEAVYNELYIISVDVDVVDVVNGYVVLINGKIAFDGKDEENTESEDIVIQVGTSHENISVALVPQFSSGATVTPGEYILSGFDVPTFDTTTEGEKILTITYGSNSYTITINVVGNTQSYDIIAFEEPKFVDSYNINSITENKYNYTGSTDKKGFSDLNNRYLVGDDNAFKFSPVMMVKYSDNSVGTIDNFTIGYNLYTVAVDKTETVVTDKSLYVKEFNASTHEFNFVNGMNGVYRLEVYPTSDPQKVVSFTFELVDGYNVYNAQDLSLFDTEDQTGKWTAYRTEKGIDLSVKDAKNINTMILHNDITVTKDDIPSVHFFTDSQLNSSDPDYNRAIGSLIDSDYEDDGLQYFYKRVVGNGETFKLEGNYFQLDFSKIPLIVRGASSAPANKVNANNTAITTHTGVFGVIGVQDETSNPSAEFNNIALKGNAKKSENTSLSGGILGVKTEWINFTAYNNFNQTFYIPYMFRNAPESNFSTLKLHQYVSKIVRSNIYDAYNTLLYNWGSKNVYIDSSNLIAAGGPVMICDHVANEEKHGGSITSVYIDKLLTHTYNGNTFEYYQLDSLGNKTNKQESVLESWVAGSEGWFETYTGSGAIVSSLKAMNQLMTPYRKTMLDVNSEKINLVAVYKSGSVEGLTETNIGGVFQKEGYNALDASGASLMTKKYEIMTAIMQANPTISETELKEILGKMCVIETCNTTDVPSTLGVPGTSGWFTGSAPDTNTLIESKEFVYIYLFNGMAAVLGLSNLTA